MFVLHKQSVLVVQYPRHTVQYMPRRKYIPRYFSFRVSRPARRLQCINGLFHSLNSSFRAYRAFRFNHHSGLFRNFSCGQYVQSVEGHFRQYRL